MIQKVALGFLVGGAIFLALHHLVGSAASAEDRDVTKEKISCDQVLLKIYHEVLELGYRENEDYIKREFHFDLDGSRDNREEHVLVLSYKDGRKEKVILQLTFFNKIESSFVRHAKEVKKITCLVEGDSIEIKEFGFNKREERLLPKILEGIRNEKKLFKLIQEK